MDKNLIYNRIDLAGVSTGSVISIATWCALHGSNAQVIVECICERITSMSASLEKRRNLLFVIHELLLTCLTRGVTENGRSSILLAVSKTFPRVVNVLRSNMTNVKQNNSIMSIAAQDSTMSSQQRQNEIVEFMLTVQKVLAWWSVLHLFPSSWIDVIRQEITVFNDTIQKNNTLQDVKRISSTNKNDGEMSMQELLSQISLLMSRYHAVKEEWQLTYRVKNEKCNVKAEDAMKNVVSAEESEIESEWRQSALKLIDSIRHLLMSSELRSDEALRRWCDSEEEEWWSLQSQNKSNTLQEQNKSENVDSRISSLERQVASFGTTCKRLRDEETNVTTRHATALVKNETLSNNDNYNITSSTLSNTMSNSKYQNSKSFIGSNNINSTSPNDQRTATDKKEMLKARGQIVMNKNGDVHRVDEKDKQKIENEEEEEEEEDDDDVLASFY